MLLELARAWPVAVFGWGPLAIAIALSALGLKRESTRLMLVAGFVSLVPAAVVAANPAGLWALGMPLALFAGAAFVHRNQRNAAIVAVGAFWLAVAALVTIVARGYQAPEPIPLQAGEEELPLPEESPSSRL
jgi:hypothetical protein